LVRDGLRLLPEAVEAESVLLARATGCLVIAECLSTSDPDQAKEAARNGIASCERILAKGPLSPAARRALLVAVELHLELEQGKQAAIYLKRLMEIEPSPGQRLYLTYKLGKALRMAEDWDEGIRVLQQGLQQVDADKAQLPFIQYEIGVIERQIERFANAKESLRGAAEALKRDPVWGGHDLGAKEWEGAIQLELGDACYELGQYEEALVAYRQAAEALATSDLRHGEALLWRGHCHYVLEAYDQAQLCYEEVLANKIAGPKHLEAADEGIRNCHWAVAEAQRKAGRLKEAAAEYEVLASLYPDSELRCRALLWLAHCQALLWRRMDTRRTYEKILASKGATPDQRKDAQEALAHTGPIAWLLRWLMQ
jgi:tetratricopeptide (TPR) repeat protein